MRFTKWNFFIDISNQREDADKKGGLISPYLFFSLCLYSWYLNRNYKNLKGMNIDGEEFKISQYADVIYHCSPKPLDEILEEMIDINYTKNN